MYILASASPRRKELLGLLTSDFSVDVPLCEEVCPDDMPVCERPRFLACLKAREVAKSRTDGIIIAADTAVISDGRMLGKPKDSEEAVAMLLSLSGKTHKVITGCCISDGEKEECFSVETEVAFYSLTEEEIKSYVETGEPFDKAGAYGIQGRGCVLVKGINGDYFNVVGLPVAELSRRLSAF